MNLCKQDYLCFDNYEKTQLIKNLKDKLSIRIYKGVFSKFSLRLPLFFLNDLLERLKPGKYKEIIAKFNRNISHFIFEPRLCMNPDFEKYHFETMFNLSISNFSEYDKGLFFFDEPGLGKTGLAICSLVMYYYANKIEYTETPIVVFVPKTLIGQWISAINYYQPDLKVSTSFDNESDVYIVNYEKIDKCNLNEFTTIIDEGHNLTTSGTKRYEKFFYKLKHSLFTIILTGTPIRENILDLFTLYALFSNKISSVKTFYRVKSFLKMINSESIKSEIIANTIINQYSMKQKKDVIKNVGTISREPVNVGIDDFKFRKYKLALDVLDDKFKYYIDLHNKVKELEKTKYKEYLEKYLLMSSDKKFDEIKLNIRKENIPEDIKKLILDHIDFIKVKSKQSASSKVWSKLLSDTILFIMNNNPKVIRNELIKHNKVLVVTKSRAIVPDFMKILKEKYNIEGVTIESKHSYNDRMFLVDKFKNKENIKYLISTYDIVSAGLNMGFVDLILILDFPYKAHNYIQLINRFHRLDNVYENKVVKYLNLSYKYNILQHHKNLLFNNFKQYSYYMNVIQEKQRI